MKKYNLSKIMKRAWELVKAAGCKISAALREAWKEAKEAMNKKVFEKFAKVPVMYNGEVNPYIGTSNDSECNYFYFRRWERGPKRRIYINDYKGRTVGYIDMLDGSVSADTRQGMETAYSFLEMYAF